jgi:hypothetical protein
MMIASSLAAAGHISAIVYELHDLRFLQLNKDNLSPSNCVDNEQAPANGFARTSSTGLTSMQVAGALSNAFARLPSAGNAFTRVGSTASDMKGFSRLASAVGGLGNAFGRVPSCVSNISAISADPVGSITRAPSSFIPFSQGGRLDDVGEMAWKVPLLKSAPARTCALTG